MQFSKAAILAFAAFSLAAPAAAPPQDCTTSQFHAHHKHKRDVVYNYAYVTVTVDGQGRSIAVSEAAKPTSVAQKSSAVVSEAAEQTSTNIQQSSVAEQTSTNIQQSSVATTTSSTSANIASTQQAASSSSAPSSSNAPSLGGGSLGDYQDPTQEFPDGVYSCSTFPEGQGVIPLDYLGFGGWSGVENSDGSTGGNCKEGAYCSYACQSGMSKTQWPQNQPANGVSIGGLLCKGGKLYKSNSRSNYLCEWGANKAIVQNNLSQSVAICRTDYPGTENMVIPTIVGGGNTSPLTVVDQSSYYTWMGGSTSAQYYVNDAGVSQEDGCIWGTPGSGIGNWSPLNFGAGYANGIAYLSLIPNPNNYDSLNFKVKIVADGSNSVVSGDCSYENGQYNGGSSQGCTVGVTSGRAKFVLYN